MTLDLGTELSRLCAQVSSFGEVLNEVRLRRRLSQEDLARVIARSPADVSRLINNKVPKSLTFTDVHMIASSLDCSREEVVQLVNALICHIHYIHGAIDPDIF